jgi:hypothetical protein
MAMAWSAMSILATLAGRFYISMTLAIGILRKASVTLVGGFAVLLVALSG